MCAGNVAVGRCSWIRSSGKHLPTLFRLLFGIAVAAEAGALFRARGHC